ncbi:unnamed protein product [Arctia plantaginis]|uniref:Uncharacterized protein n=1 Tax=Arctia plantaginis TaxID=874455 RepID=A0A8S1AZD8_ARCPL|nr:unnamed protein product [Arctia plantaginis]CAB3254797.1 unnamed protein product [Arctia plantaginis]
MYSRFLHKTLTDNTSKPPSGALYRTSNQPHCLSFRSSPPAPSPVAPLDDVTTSAHTHLVAPLLRACSE